MNGKKSLVVLAAVAGLLGTGVVLSGCASKGASKATDKHACKGMNACKGQGGCGVEGKNSCKGMNACKGQGGCATDGSSKNSCSGKSGGSSCGANTCG